MAKAALEIVLVDQIGNTSQPSAQPAVNQSSSFAPAPSVNQPQQVVAPSSGDSSIQSESEQQPIKVAIVSDDSKKSQSPQQTGAFSQQAPKQDTDFPPISAHSTPLAKITQDVTQQSANVLQDENADAQALAIASKKQALARQLISQQEAEERRLAREQREAEQEEKKQRQAPFDTFRKYQQGAQTVAGRIGGPVARTVGASSEAATAVSSLTSSFGKAGFAVGALAVAVGGAVVAVKSLVSAFTSAVEQVKPYSAPVAAASAESEIREQFAILRRSESLGPQLANFERFRGKFEERMMEAWTKILEILLNIFDEIEPATKATLAMAAALPEIIEVFVHIGGIAAGGGANLGAVIGQAIGVALAGGESPLQQMLNKVVEKFEAAMKDDDDPIPLNDPFFEELQKAFIAQAANLGFGLDAPAIFAPAPGP